MSLNSKANINRIADYIASGSKKSSSKNIGIECEHFITERGGKAVPFFGDTGVENILKELSCHYGNKVCSSGHLIGLDDGRVYITLEPAAQIETSIVPCAEIEDIKNLYMSFNERINNILLKYSYTLVTSGYQPFSKAEELTLIPKERYYLMDEYFKSVGTNAMWMMRGSASVQVNIDYFDETDFSEKYRLANLLSPLFYLITDNADVFEGKKYSGFSARSMIWQNVDGKRCELSAEAFDKGFGFKEYAEWVCSVPPIFIMNGDSCIKTGKKTAEQIFDGREINEGEIKHILSMVFPDIRAKQFIEIRCGDSMPPEFMLSYAALIKGLFYNCDALGYFNNLFKNVKYRDICRVKKDIQKNGFKSDYFGCDIKKLTKKAFSYAEEGLESSEKDFLRPLKTSAENSQTVRQALISKEILV